MDSLAPIDYYFPDYFFVRSLLMLEQVKYFMKFLLLHAHRR